MLDRSPQANRYYSDDCSPSQTPVYYPRHHQPVSDKSQTYSVEGDNDELRHYLARLARRSRRFSRCLKALWNALTLFGFAWKRRQMYRRLYPGYPAHVRDFVHP